MKKWTSCSAILLLLGACSDTSGIENPPKDTHIPADTHANEPDSTTADTVLLEDSMLLQDSSGGCQPGDGCFEEPCEGADDCLTGICTLHMGANVCSKTCDQTCPSGWNCQLVGGAGGDAQYVCVSNFPHLCLPCADAGDCASETGPIACIRLGDEGSFCGGSCDEATPCPEGYTCSQAETVSGVITNQCSPVSGVCSCTQNAIESALSTPCLSDNAFGSCQGLRVCTEEGLTACNASTPSDEICNGLDDDCNGLTDELGCDDDNPCTVDTCAGESGCQHDAMNQGECLDGDVCTIADHCEAGTCVGTPVKCEDDNPCTEDACDDTGGCAFTPVSAVCEDGNPCTLGDMCLEGSCQGNVTLDCDDGNPCTDDACGQEGCTATPNIAPCDDGNQCTKGDGCKAGACTYTELVACNDGNPCTHDACDPGTGCTQTFNTSPCNDNDLCTLGDACKDGGCLPGEGNLPCTDGNPCTDDACAPALGCVFEPNEADCDDKNTCTVVDTCVQGSCLGAGGVLCDDGNPCTLDNCLPDNGCTHSNNLGGCSDGNPCTLDDTCVNGDCASGQTFSCDDGNPCTDDECDPKLGCIFKPSNAPCEDGNPCTEDDACNQGTCTSGKPASCDDGLFCNGFETCAPNNGCVPGEAPVIDDGVGCTVDVCDNDQAAVVHEPNDDACQVEGLCESPICHPIEGCQVNVVPNCCGNSIVEANEECDDGNSLAEDGCSPKCENENKACFEDWLVGSPCNGVNYGNGCSPEDTGYHFKGIFDGYACFWHHKNQAWNTGPQSNFWHLALSFGVAPGVGKCHWCDQKNDTPTPDAYDSCSGYFQEGNVGAWGWCAESDANSVGFVCIPAENGGNCP
jgi:cysteine-rich repeat protein